jgi:hypothetical protein
MRRLGWLLISLGLGFSSPTESGEDTARFVGTWKLVSVQNDAGPDIRGDRPIGLIHYDAAGNMAVQIMPDRPRPKWKAGEPPTPDEAKEAMTGYAAYFGTYTVDEKAGTVSHQRQGSLVPGTVGVDAVRRYEFLPGERLLLTPVENPSLHLTWERVR